MVDLTGADNVVISLMLQGFTKAEKALIPEIQEFSELGAAYERVKTYSAGMRTDV